MLKQILVIIVLLFSTESVFTQSLSLVKPVDVSSFRNNALGGIINDDLDLIYDPVELNYVRNLHIYTNLSNLTSTHEQLFNNNTPGDNMFLLGVSGENPFMPNLTHAVLFSFQKSQIPGTVFLSPDLSNSYGGIYGTGYLENNYYNYSAIGANGLYSREEYVVQNKSSYDYLNGYKFVLNNSYSYKDLIFGLKFIASNSKQENNRNSTPLGEYAFRLMPSDYDDPSFQQDYLLTDLGLNTPLMHYNQKGNFDSYTETPLIFFNASVSRKLIDTDEKALEVRADFKYSKYQQNSSTNDYYSGSYSEYEPGVQNYLLNYVNNAGYISNTKENGSWFGLNGELRYVFIRQPQRINEGFVNLKMEYVHSSFTYSSNLLSTLVSADKEYITTLNNSLHNNYVYDYNTEGGTGNDNNCTISTKINMPLADGVFFGIGFIFNYMSREIKTQYTNSDNSVYKVSSLDASLTAVLQSTQTVFSASEENHTINNSINQFIVPVGIEYKFTKNNKWAVRFGSIFSYITSTYDYAAQIINTIPETTKLEVVGEDTKVTYSPDNFYSSLNKESIVSISSTVFTYGLGYTPTENLQIDVIGFFEVNNNVSLLEYMKSLRLSFALKW
jgi:hypothetical protein